MSIFRDVSATGALRGLAEQWRANPYRWRTLAASIALTAIVFYLFIPPDERVPPRPFEITYISTFAQGRSDAEIAASNLANQKLQEERRKLERERLQLRRDFAEALGRASGLDVDAMKEDIAREEAAAERERERLRAEIMAQAAQAKQARAVGGQ